MTANANLVRMVALIAGLVASAAGCGGAHDASTSTERGHELGPSSSVADHEAEHRPGFIAVLTARESAEVVVPYTTASAAVLVKLGDVVAAGQVVGRLDDRELRRDLAIARSQQRTVGAQIAQAEIDARGAEVVSRREHAADTAGVSSHAEAVAAGQAFAKASAALRYVRTSAEERQVRISALEAQLRDDAGRTDRRSCRHGLRP
jgi:multidrug efflux pump subunit AcrA (membrane-fusion protein)